MLDLRSYLIPALCEVFKPVEMAYSDIEGRSELTTMSGIDFTLLDDESLFAILGNFHAHFSERRGAASSPQATLGELATALNGLTQLFKDIKSLPRSMQQLFNVFPEQNPDVLGLALVDVLILDFLERWYPGVYQFAICIGAVREDPNVSIACFRRKIDLPLFASAIKDPRSRLLAEYITGISYEDSGSISQISDILFPRIGRIIETLGGCYLYNMEGNYNNTLELTAEFGADGAQLASTALIVCFPTSGGVLVGAILQLFLNDSGSIELAIAPLFDSRVEIAIENWMVVLELNVIPPAFSLGPGGLILPTDFPHSIVAGSIVLNEGPEFDEVDELGEVAFLIGDTPGTRIEIGTFTIIGSFDFDLDNPSLDDFGIEANALNGKLVVAPSDGDTFLKAVLPAEGIAFDFDFGIGWSRKRGLYFKGAGSLDAAIPINVGQKDSDVLHIPTLYLALRANEQGIWTEVSAAVTLQLGPFSATADRLGMFASFDFKEDYDGNLGPIDLDLGFKPPTGIGLKLEAGALSGGGFLKLDYEKGEYTGAVLLEFDSLALQAIGLLNTKLEDDPEGFSLLVLISAEFPPLQLGFGLTLDGVGGLLGVHRSANTEALQAGLRQGTLDSILFPVDVVNNAPTILRDLKAVCPPTPDRYLLGPMVRLAWGQPVLVRATVAVLFEFPEPFRLILLGKLTASFPSETEQLVLLQLDVLGVLDLDARTAAVDATLRDSHILDFPLSGDFALRASWGSCTATHAHDCYARPRTPTHAHARCVPSRCPLTGPAMVYTPALAPPSNLWRRLTGSRIHKQVLRVSAPV